MTIVTARWHKQALLLLSPGENSLIMLIIFECMSTVRGFESRRCNTFVVVKLLILQVLLCFCFINVYLHHHTPIFFKVLLMIHWISDWNRLRFLGFTCVSTPVCHFWFWKIKDLLRSALLQPAWWFSFRICFIVYISFF